MTEQQSNIEELLPRELHVDHDVQRPLDPRRVGRIVADFDRDALGTIVVSRRSDGTLHVVDGQHRTAAAIAIDAGRPLRCEVYEGLTLAEEASLFRRLNTSRAVTALDKFRVRVVEGDKAATEIMHILNEHGWKLGSARSGGFNAVTAIEHVYAGPDGEQADVETCERVISVLTTAWGHDRFGAHASIIEGVGAVLARHRGAVDQAKLAAELGQCEGGPRMFLGRARSLREMHGGTVRDAVAQSVVNLLNKRRTARVLPSWL